MPTLPDRDIKIADMTTGHADDLPKPSRAWMPRSAAVIFGIVLAVRLWAAIPLFSPTTDEPSDIGAAVAMAESGKAIAGVTHAPLPRWLMAASLWHDGARLPMFRRSTTVGREDLGYALGTHVLYHQGLPSRMLLEHVRRLLLIVPMTTLIYLYLLGRQVVGERAASCAVIAFSVDPTLLAHGFLATTDVAGCLGVLAALYHGYRWIDRPTNARAAVAGLAVGLAISMKFSCLFAVPALGIVTWRRRSTLSVSRKKCLAHFAVIGGVAFAAVWASYRFDIGRLGDQRLFGHPSEWDQLPHWFLAAPVPMPGFFLGIAELWRQNHFGMRAYLNGQVSRSGWWYYFPEALLLKSPLGFLIALAIAVAVWLFCRRPGRPWAAMQIGWPLAVLGYFLLTSRYDLGVRYLLPVIALLQLFTAWQLSRGKWIAVFACLTFISATETARSHPDYLSFFNAAAGGTAGGSRYLLDSNLDWNQDLYRLADEIRHHPQRVPYSLRLTGSRNARLLDVLKLDPAALDRPVHGTVLYISKDKRLLDGTLPWLQRHKPIATVGASIDVYDLREPGLPFEPEDVPAPDDPSAYFGDEIP